MLLVLSRDRADDDGVALGANVSELLVHDLLACLELALLELLELALTL